MPIPSYFSKVATLAALLVIVSITGCVPWARGIRSLDDTVTDWRDFVWGKRAYYQRYGHDRSKAFMDGFLEGYHEILEGGDGCLPVVPPKRYWGWRYQSAGGQSAISDWFSGFEAGVAAAREDGLSSLSCIPISNNYNGLNDVPIEVMTDEAEGTSGPGMGPADRSSPPLAEPVPAKGAKVTKPGTLQKKVAELYKNGSSGQPVQALDTSRNSPAGMAESLPLGGGVIQVSPMMQPDSRPLPVSNLAPPETTTLAEKETSAMPRPFSASSIPGAVQTSRRSREMPLSSGPYPANENPLNSSVYLPAVDPSSPTRR